MHRYPECMNTDADSTDISTGFALDAAAPKLIYIQVADWIDARIRSGVLAPGSQLPGEIALAAGFRVALTTIRRAADVLRDRGLIVTVVGRGTFVTPAGQEGDQALPEGPEALPQ